MYILNTSLHVATLLQFLLHEHKCACTCSYTASVLLNTSVHVHVATLLQFLLNTTLHVHKFGSSPSTSLHIHSFMLECAIEIPKCNLIAMTTLDVSAIQILVSPV